MQTVRILLTKYPDIFSQILHWLTRSEYTHASISVGRREDGFFSFNTKKGFAVEKPWLSSRPEKKYAPCALYEIEVSDDVYADIRRKLERFAERRDEYKYSTWGLILCLLHISHRVKKGYFCSQFVAELLQASGAAKLRRKPSLYLPKDFPKEPQLRLHYKGNLSGMIASA